MTYVLRCLWDFVFRKRKLERRIKKSESFHIYIYVYNNSKNHSIYIVLSWTKYFYYSDIHFEQRTILIFASMKNDASSYLSYVLHKNYHEEAEYLDRSYSSRMYKEGYSNSTKAEIRFVSDSEEALLCKIHIWWNTHFYLLILDNYNMRRKMFEFRVFDSPQYRRFRLYEMIIYLSATVLPPFFIEASSFCTPAGVLLAQQPFTLVREHKKYCYSFTNTFDEEPSTCETWICLYRGWR